jgi:hypothetical protein
MGAVTAAVTHAASGVQYEAAATIVIPTTGAQQAEGEGKPRAEIIAEILRLPSAAAAAREHGLRDEPDELLQKVSVAGSPSSGVLAVVARDRSRAAAGAIANAFAEEGGEALIRLSADSPDLAAIEDFEVGLTEWNTERSTFGFGPGRIAITTDAPRYGGHALSVGCRALESCAAWKRVTYPFQAGRRYAVRAWVSAPARRAPIELVLGASRPDRAPARSRFAAAGWSRLIAEWTPRTSHTSAELAVRVQAGRARSFRIDGITVLDPSASARPPAGPSFGTRGEARLFADLPRPTFFPARPVGTLTPSGTLAWAILGAFLGVLVALIGAAAARAATRRG